MLLLMRFFFALLAGWAALHGNEFGSSSFSTAKESIPFSCSHQCGQWESKSIQEIEWEFTKLLYQADKMHTFLSEHSKPYRSKVLKDPLEFVFLYSKPQDFHSDWYQAMI